MSRPTQIFWVLYKTFVKYTPDVSLLLTLATLKDMFPAPKQGIKNTYYYK